MSKLIAFDIGACLGESLHRFKNYDEIYAFEPCPWSFKRLVEKYSSYNNTKFFQIAISNVAGIFPFNFHDHYGYCSLLDIDYEGELTKKNMELDPGFDLVLETISVQTQRLDNFMDQNNINNIDFLKIDTQGNDLNVIKSLGDKITKVHTIELEVQLQKMYKNAPTKCDVLDFMKLNNFDLVKIDPNTKCEIVYEENLTFINKHQNE